MFQNEVIMKNFWIQGKRKNQNKIELHENELYSMEPALNIYMKI